jgi:protein-S-isoprenylcysteine O-methyltransferase Ste14
MREEQAGQPGRQQASEPSVGSAADPHPQEGEGPPQTFAWLASLATIVVILAGQVLPRGDHAGLRAAGLVLLALSAPLIVGPFVLLHRHGQSQDGRAYMQTRAVVDRGLYGVIRHPQYLGYMLLACGFALLSQHWLAVLLAAASVTSFYGQAAREEAYCLAQWGEAYARYLRRVPRFNALLGMARLVSKSED